MPAAFRHRAPPSRRARRGAVPVGDHRHACPLRAPAATSRWSRPSFFRASSARVSFPSRQPRSHSSSI
eukprot:16318277-Heterocapsa_arctica.AAC.1